MPSSYRVRSPGKRHHPRKCISFRFLDRWFYPSTQKLVNLLVDTIIEGGRRRRRRNFVIRTSVEPAGALVVSSIESTGGREGETLEEKLLAAGWEDKFRFDVYYLAKAYFDLYPMELKKTTQVDCVCRTSTWVVYEPVTITHSKTVYR